MKIAGWYIVGGAVVLGGAAAYYYYTRQVALIRNLDYDIIAINVGSGSSLDKTTLLMTLRIVSDSTLDAEVQELFVDVYVDGQKVGTIQDQRPFVIPAKGYSDVALQVEFSPKLLFKNLLNTAINFFASKQDFAINLKGYVKVKSAFLKVTVPFTYDTSYKELTTKKPA